jgi:BMFP domain-containing protein YqiC
MMYDLKIRELEKRIEELESKLNKWWNYYIKI